MITPDKILIIRPDRLGDLILSLPVAESLKKNLAETKIHYLVSPYTAPIAPMIKYVDGWLTDSDDDGNRLSFSSLAEKIKKTGYDCIIELKPCWRTAAAGFLSGVKPRIGTSRRFYSFFYSCRISVHRKASGYHQTDLELMHLKPFDFKRNVTKPNISVTDKGLKNADNLLGADRRRFIVIHPGSGGSSPNWPLEHYRKLAVLIRENLKFEVVVTGSEAGLQGFDGCIDLGGKTDLETLAGVLSRTEIFISGSTGPLHLADALGLLCVSFFASRSDIGPGRWGPRRNLGNVLVPPVPCDCADLRKYRCLERISPREALEKLKSILKNMKTTGVKRS
ncbi:MAG: glycosyltransferase family 9 protein [Candidatus Zixiibacteriota bacterium]|nr:MAG: glycosyltransferase family 9 protein [candidate division Zixibacteria bacterium]